ncbi:J domain-containing protein [Caulobacter sp. S45]|uniref:J domain-containing protein n=1 Tax=Caulobacter sp. S45 TaxID=1641861 RepID=UPI00131DC532|nr:J domain-containing protein [Caulobacter sp. S45]
MSGAFEYRPKFVDIRIRPPKAAAEAKAEREDVNHLKPGERRCEWPDCPSKAISRAPKSREMMNEHYWFCQPHAAEYNRNWDFFAGMSEGQVAAAQASRLTGDRPTWEFKASRMSREAASIAAKMGTANGKGAGAYSDPLGVFQGVHTHKPEATTRQLGRLERRALEEMDLDERADSAAIRIRYLELVKRFHPDSNGGDRSTEQKLAKVLRAYKTLKASKLV